MPPFSSIDELLETNDKDTYERDYSSEQAAAQRSSFGTRSSFSGRTDLVLSRPTNHFVVPRLRKSSESRGEIISFIPGCVGGSYLSTLLQA